MLLSLSLLFFSHTTDSTVTTTQRTQSHTYTHTQAHPTMGKKAVVLGAAGGIGQPCELWHLVVVAALLLHLRGCCEKSDDDDRVLRSNTETHILLPSIPPTQAESSPH